MTEATLNHIRELNRLRQKRYYYAHKNEINKKHRDTYNSIYSNANKNLEIEEEITEILPTTTLSNIVSNLKNNKNIVSPSTLKKYINDISTVFNILDTNNFSNELKYANNIITKLKTFRNINDSVYSSNSIKGFIQIILFLITNYDVKISKKELKKLTDYFEELKLNSSIDIQKKQEEEEVILFEDYLKLVKNEFGELSKEFVLISLYNEVTSRDDFGHLSIIPTAKETNKINNFIIVPRDNRVARIVLNSYKTSNKYGTIKIELSRKLTELIRIYIFKNDLKYNEYLFGNTELLSGFVGKINASINISGSINTIRQMKVSEFLTKENIHDINKRVEIGNSLMHSPITSLKYLRTIKV